jgi:hypothetical protein
MCALSRFDKPAVANGGPLSLVMETASTLFALLCRLMQREANQDLCKSVHRHLVLFMNAFSKLDSNLTSANSNGDVANIPSWISRYNYLSLFNLPDQMNNFGPLLNLWEGGLLGEKIVQTMKPEIKSGFRKNWQIHLFHKWYRKMFFCDMTAKGFQIVTAGME